MRDSPENCECGMCFIIEAWGDEEREKVLTDLGVGQEWPCSGGPAEEVQILAQLPGHSHVYDPIKADVKTG